MSNSMNNSSQLVNELLTEWNLLELIPIFQSKRITDQVLQNLKSDRDFDFIESNALKLQFIHKLTIYRNSKQEVSELASAGKGKKTDVKRSTQLNSKQRHSVPEDTSEEYSSDDDVNDIVEIIRGTSIENRESEIQGETSENSGTLSAASCSRQVHTSRIHEERARIDSINSEIENLDLRELLLSTQRGRCLISVYNVENALTARTDLDSLQEIVCDWLSLQNLYPTPNQFITVRRKIADLFSDDEKSNKFLQNIFYVAAAENLTSKKRAYGKLFNGMRNLRRLMRKKYLLLDREDSDDSDVESSASLPGVSDKEQKSLDFLKKKQEPPRSVKKHWKITSKCRLDKLLIQKGSVSDYTSEYKALRLSNGSKLIEIDFVYLHPGKEESLFVKWEDFAVKATSLVRKTNVNDGIYKDLKRALTDVIPHDSRDAILLQLLPGLLPGKSTVKDGNKVSRSKIEYTRDTFIEYLEIPGKLLEVLAERKRNAIKLRTTLQPQLIIVGPDRKKPDAFYVIIDDFYYKLDSVKEALDTCFKAFYALNARYPCQCEDIWRIIQSELYGIEDENQQPLSLNATSFLLQLNQDSDDPKKRKTIPIPEPSQTLRKKRRTN